MAPTEATILSTFLLPPAPLPSIISLKAFTELFPRSQQSSPQVKALYRDLQQQRARLTDSVARSIAGEVKRGNAQRRIVVRARREAEKEGQDDEVDVEHAVRVAIASLLVQPFLISVTALWLYLESACLEASHSDLDIA
jgi:centromere-localized protein 2